MTPKRGRGRPPKQTLHPVWAKVFQDIREPGDWQDGPPARSKENGRPPKGVTVADDHVADTLKWVVEKGNRGRIVSCHHRRDKRIAPLIIPAWRLAMYVEDMQAAAAEKGKRLTKRKAVFEVLRDKVFKRFKFASDHATKLQMHSPLVETVLKALRRHSAKK